MALALFGWAAVTALWAPEPLRALGTALQIGGFVALGAGAARAMAAEDEAARRRLLLAATGGLVAGLVVAALDAMTGHAIRAAVRGLKEVPVTLAFGLKPAASAMGAWLPLVAAAGLARWLRGAILAAGAVVLVLLPGEAAKLAVVAGGWPAARRCWRRAGRRGCWAPGWPLAILAMPVVLGPVLARGVPADGIAPSAAHRLLIWDFVTDRIAERPVARLGHGGEPGNPRPPDSPTAEPPWALPPHRPRRRRCGCRRRTAAAASA